MAGLQSEVRSTLPVELKRTWAIAALAFRHRGWRDKAASEGAHFVNFSCEGDPGRNNPPHPPLRPGPP